LEKSREAQNKVSEELAEQVLGALYELIKGIQTADQDARGKVLGKYLREHPELVYHGLLTVLMRLIFLLFAEDKGVMPAGALWSRNYSVHGLFERLRDDAQKHGVNMDKRYGAWGQLLTTFNLVYNGCDHPQLKMPARLGYLFDPKRYPFLSRDEAGNQPLVSDAIIHSVLRSLLVLGGERISYRALSVENIGVVYETMMGFSVYQAKGACVVLKGAQAPAACELDELMALEGAKRITFIEELTGWKPNAKAGAAIKAAKDHGEILDALTDRIRRDITPRPLTQGGLTLQPGEERRKSGSHYTPQQLTRPLVAKAFEPHFNRMGDKPDPDAVLSMTVCDPAMGSGAFLVEATRQLSDKLLEAWAAYPDKDPCKKLGADDRVFVAMRMVAQRCIYGVDRNPAAVDLAKMSMWLLTISKDHPFTFMDHSLKHGDALVGMSKEQIRKFHWDLSKGGQIIESLAALNKDVESAVAARLELRALDADNTLDLQVKLSEAESKIQKARQAGDLLLYAWFTKNTEKEKLHARDDYAVRLGESLEPGSKERKAMHALRLETKPLIPFHWELEFPEVFSAGGFNVFAGNPPFISGGDISGIAGQAYLDYIKAFFGHYGQSDIVADFFLNSFRMLNAIGTMGMVATNSISSGDTKRTALDRITESGSEIYFAEKNARWPGRAVVVIALIAISKGPTSCPIILDGKEVPVINAQLCSDGDGMIPSPLSSNSKKSTSGFYNYGNGFVFKDGDPDCNELSVLKSVLQLNPGSKALIHPFLTGDDILSNYPRKINSYVVDADELTLSELSKGHPMLHEILLRKVKPLRDKCNRPKRRDNWWKYGESSPGLRAMLKRRKRVLACAFLSTHLSFIFVDTEIYVSSPNVVFDFDDYATFGMLQSSIHDVWFRRFGSKLGKGKRYTASDCFTNFPFPAEEKLAEKLTVFAESYYAEREQYLSNRNIGLTEFYKQIHGISPDPGIQALRMMHIDLAARTAEAYGWDDLGERIRAGRSPAISSELEEVILKRLIDLHGVRLSAERSVITDKVKSKASSDNLDLFNL
jgi:hypothetical protein